MTVPVVGDIITDDRFRPPGEARGPTWSEWLLSTVD